MCIGVGAYLAVSLVGAVVNLAVSVALVQWVLLATLMVMLRLTRRSVVRFTGLGASRPRAWLLGALVGLGNTFLIAGPLHALSVRVFPKWLVKMFDFGDVLNRAEFNALERGVLIGAAVLAAPIVEELFFRGVFQNGLERWNPRRALVISAVVFSAYHLDPVGFVARVEMGLMLGWLFWKTRSVDAGISAHATNNIMAVIGTMAASGAQDESTWVEYVQVAAVGAVLLGLAFWLLRRSTPEQLNPRPAEDVETRPRGFFSETIPWVTAAVVLLAGIVRFDFNGVQLNIVDLMNPLPRLTKPNADQVHERAVLIELREAARAGNAPVAAYAALRSALKAKATP